MNVKLVKATGVSQSGRVEWGICNRRSHESNVRAPHKQGLTFDT